MIGLRRVHSDGAVFFASCLLFDRDMDKTRFDDKNDFPSAFIRRLFKEKVMFEEIKSDVAPAVFAN